MNPVKPLVRVTIGRYSPKEYKVIKANVVYKVIPVPKVPKVPMVHKERPVLKETKVYRVIKAPMVPQVPVYGILTLPWSVGILKSPIIRCTVVILKNRRLTTISWMPVVTSISFLVLHLTTPTYFITSCHYVMVRREPMVPKVLVVPAVLKDIRVLMVLMVLPVRVCGIQTLPWNVGIMQSLWLK
jgi:hypothetical protein